MNKTLIFLVVALLSCAPKVVNPPVLPEPDRDLVVAPQAEPVEPVETKPPAPKPKEPEPEPVKPVGVAIIDFDAVYEKAPALQRLRKSLDNYGPAQEYAALSLSSINTLSPENQNRMKVLKIIVRTKMVEIEQQCRDLINQTIGQTGVKYAMIYDIKGRAYVSSSIKTSSQAPMNQVNITNSLIEILK